MSDGTSSKDQGQAESTGKELETCNNGEDLSSVDMSDINSELSVSVIDSEQESPISNSDYEQLVLFNEKSLQEIMNDLVKQSDRKHW